MPRGVNLETLIYNLRSEVGVSTNPAVSRSTRGRYITLLNRVQRRLYADFDWPFLNIHRDVQMQAGSRYYDFPDDIDMDRQHRFEVKNGGYWQKVGYKITQKQMNEYDSDADVRSDPVWRWDYYLEDGAEEPQFEAWPIPATDGDVSTLEGHVRIHGTQKLTTMVADADKCIIDSDLLVLYAAAEILAKMGTSDASAKLENANALYTKLKSRGTPATPFKVGGDTYNSDNCRRGIELRVAYAGQTPEE